MLRMNREVTTDGETFLKVNVIGEREIYMNDELITGSEKLYYEDQRTLDMAIDIFEDGGNSLENEYEVYSYGSFTIKRKVELNA